MFMFMFNWLGLIYAFVLIVFNQLRMLCIMLLLIYNLLFLYSIISLIDLCFCWFFKYFISHCLISLLIYLI